MNSGALPAGLRFLLWSVRERGVFAAPLALHVFLGTSAVIHSIGIRIGYFLSPPVRCAKLLEPPAETFQLCASPLSGSSSAEKPHPERALWLFVSLEAALLCGLDCMYSIVLQIFVKPLSIGTNGTSMLISLLKTSAKIKQSE